MDDVGTRDARLRQTAFDYVTRTAALQGGVPEYSDLARGFDYEGRRVPLINPQRGIFKPREMAWLLSVKTVFSRRGGQFGTTISGMLTGKSTQATIPSSTPSWARTRLLLTTAGSMRRWSDRFR